MSITLILLRVKTHYDILLRGAAEVLNGGRNQERPLIVFGRYLRIACARKAQALGVKRYSWRQLSRESGTSYSVVTKAVAGEDRPEPENVWKWIDTLQPGPELERLICHSLKYSTRLEVVEAETKIDALEQGG